MSDDLAREALAHVIATAAHQGLTFRAQADAVLTWQAAQPVGDAEVEAARERMGRVMGWQYLMRYAGPSDEWLHRTLDALARAALTAAREVR